MAGHGEKLSRNKEKAIAALLLKPSIPAAAKDVGIGERTLWRWLKDRNFKRAYKEARREVVRQAIAQVQAGLSKAVKTLKNIIDNENAPPSARVSAARVMIDMGLKAIEIEDLESRIEVLEAKLSN
jgi:hypothetical protein